MLYSRRDSFSSSSPQTGHFHLVVVGALALLSCILSVRAARFALVCPSQSRAESEVRASYVRPPRGSPLLATQGNHCGSKSRGETTRRDRELLPFGRGVSEVPIRAAGWAHCSNPLAGCRDVSDRFAYIITRRGPPRLHLFFPPLLRSARNRFPHCQKSKVFSNVFWVLLSRGGKTWPCTRRARELWQP